MNKIKALVCVIIPIAIGFIFNAKFGDLPPILKFLNPFTGFWQNAEPIYPINNKHLVLKNAKSEIQISFDDRMIPHIFAQNDHDVYYAQGYVTAMHRLWQMDFQTRFAAGRISEVVGAKAIELDKYQRRMGMVYGAEKSLEGMMKDPQSREMLLAYTQGINDYIKSLKPSNYPIEYKLLDFKPEQWEPIKCALILKQISATLAMGSDEIYMSNILKKFGPSITKDLFPDYPFKEDPIIPVGTQWDFTPVAIPKTPEVFNQMMAANIRTNQIEDGIGSNNWAVSGNKTKSGSPILANDPHLNLTLPSIWYQIQLTAPGINTYGVSIPGSPSIIIGFNKNIAWGVTNVAADVLDFYQIKFKENNHNEYWYNNQWKKTTIKLETIKIKGQPNLIDTVYYTHHGPVVYMQKTDFKNAKNIPIGHALKWIAHETSNELKTFYILNRGKNYDDYRRALPYFSAPAQNFVFASKDNDIAITVNGKLPLKWKNQGKFILDGTRADNDWQGWIPAAQNPTVKNPVRQFVSSANQSSTDPSYPYYINWEFSSYERGKRINDKLSMMKNITIDSMKKMQMDNYSIFAENLIPYIIPLLEPKNFNKNELKGYEAIKNWNKHYDSKAIGASIFEIWNNLLFEEIWSDKFKDPHLPMRFPSRDRTVELIQKEPNSKWYDNTKTPQKETLKDLVMISFKKTIDSLYHKYGNYNDNWAWDNVKHTNVPHLAKIPGFGSKTLMIGGAKSTIDALAESNGPSWRMIVELGKKTTGYGVFPGGQSGNPGSLYYDNMIEYWSRGDLYPLYLMQTPNDKNVKLVTQFKITKK